MGEESLMVIRRQVQVRGRPAHYFGGGQGSPLLLVHGGWGNARFHWQRVWEPLARRHRVIAPDLPGLGAVDQPALTSVREYACWLVELLSALGIERAVCVGNSFGASVVWTLASSAPAHCDGLVLVNGFAMPRTPPWLARAGQSRTARAVMRWLLWRFVYTERALPRAFARPAERPPELTRIMAEDWRAIVPRYAELLIEGDGAPRPARSPLLLWGEADRLPGSSLRDAQRLHRSLPGSRLRVLASAGHFPQVEAPEAFVAALEEDLLV